MARASPPSWTCARCEVTVSFMPGAEQPDLPKGWSDEGGTIHCLACRRELAAEAELEAAPEDTPPSEHAKLMARAKIDFELKRDPDRADTQIASACRTSIAAVRQARERLGV
jgi:uncharacterized protein YdaU (DUF1376 family)